MIEIIWQINQKILKASKNNCNSWKALRTSPSSVPRTFPKDPIWLSWGHLDLMSLGHPNQTSWGRPKMTSRGRPNLTFKGRPWKVDSGRPHDVLWTSSTGSSEYSNLDVLAFFKNFSSRTYSIDLFDSIRS